MLSHSEGWEHYKKLGGDAAKTGDSKWPEEYSILNDAILGI